VVGGRWAGNYELRIKNYELGVRDQEQSGVRGPEFGVEASADFAGWPAHASRNPTPSNPTPPQTPE
jgi:hypothetical protein